MIEVTEISQVREHVEKARMLGRTVGFVPTMGYLHDGHLSLVRESKKNCDYTVVSIFVNPTQFAPTEDLDKYPRNYEKDKQLLMDLDVDLLYFPSNESLYSSGHSTWVIEDSISNKLCGRTRKGHFRGVLTIVAKLFNIAMPDIAFFGQKDYQQITLIMKMVRELDFKVQIRIIPTVRESDGLAMSSRNSYLNADERRDALIFSRTLMSVQNNFDSGEKSVLKLVTDGMKYFTENSAYAELEYLEILDADNLDEIETIEGNVVVAIAGKVGTTRLIDNTVLPGIPGVL